MILRTLAVGAMCGLLAATAQAQGSSPGTSPLAGGDAVLKRLLDEAVRGNAEIKAAAHEAEAARQRVSPAGALDDPMLEFGLLNVPTQSLRLNREDMTMKMLGLSQRIPGAGKRALREEVAAKDAQAVAQAYRETVHRVARDVRLSYYDLALAQDSARLLRENIRVLEQFVRIAEGRYRVGQGTQADVLKAQTQLARMQEEILRMEREIPVAEAEIARLLGRAAPGAAIDAPLPGLRDAGYEIAALRELALKQRPQLVALRTLVEKGDFALDLARRESSPDFDVRLAYGQREKTTDGMPRSDMISVTVAVNLPIWGRQKIEPRIAEAQAMRDQAASLYQAQQNEVFAKLRQQLAIAQQSRKSAELFDTAILPQARLAVESTLASYRVNRADLLMLLDSQMSLYGYGIGRASAVVALNRALAEIELLTGRDPSAQ